MGLRFVCRYVVSENEVRFWSAWVCRQFNGIVLLESERGYQTKKEMASLR